MWRLWPFQGRLWERQPQRLRKRDEMKGGCGGVIRVQRGVAHKRYDHVSFSKHFLFLLNRFCLHFICCLENGYIISLPYYRTSKMFYRMVSFCLWRSRDKYFWKIYTCGKNVPISSCHSNLHASPVIILHQCILMSQLSSSKSPKCCLFFEKVWQINE